MESVLRCVREMKTTKTISSVVFSPDIAAFVRYLIAFKKGLSDEKDYTIATVIKSNE